MIGLLPTLRVALALELCTQLVLVRGDVEFLKGQGCGARAEMSTKIQSESEANQCDFFIPSKQTGT